MVANTIFKFSIEAIGEHKQGQEAVPLETVRKANRKLNADDERNNNWMITFNEMNNTA